MFGYATTLRSRTQGRATYSMVFDHYEEVPSIQENCWRQIAESKIINVNYIININWI